MIKRLKFAVAAFAAAIGLLGAGELSAQAYPSKPVRILVPLTAGGLVDILARAMAQELTRFWGQQVVVENRPGANTIVASEVLAKAAPDGYTMMLANPAAISINQFLFKKLSYDPERDFAPVFNVAYAPTIIVVTPSFPANTLREFVALAKAKPGELAYGSFGIGSAAHIDIESFSAVAGVKMNHVPYKGVADVLPAVASGQIQIGFSGIPPATGLVKQGRLKPLAINAPNRSPILPDVPTLAEAGFPGLKLGGWFGLIVPAATPRPTIEKIAADLGEIFRQPDVLRRITTGVGLEPLLQGPDQFAEFVREERVRYSRLVKTLNLSLD